MVDKTLLISPNGVFLFHLKQLFWAYVFPVFMGLFSVVSVQVYSRVGSVRDIKMHTAFLCASTAAMINLWGWSHMIRTPAMIPFYGCGVGLAAAMMSRMFAIVQQQRTRWNVKVPRVIWKGNRAEIEAMKARMQRAA